VETTVGSLVDGATRQLVAGGIATPRLDAEVLLAHVLGIARTGVLASPDAPVGDGSADAYRGLIDRRVAGEPVAYLRGMREFHGLAFAVDARVLIPRPETEQLVDLAFERVRAQLTGAPRPPDGPPVRVWDVATGSGAVAVALAAQLRRRGFLDEVRIVASDLSSDALSVAIENAVAHGVADRVDLVQGDLLDIPDPAPVDLVTANLPYIPSGLVPTLAAEVRAEPALALDGGPDGLDLVRRLLAGLPDVLLPGGSALLEMGEDQADLMATAVASLLPAWSLLVHEDLARSPRIAEVFRSDEPPRRVSSGP
jgi:release factor glutamine methyltransferase